MVCKFNLYVRGIYRIDISEAWSKKWANAELQNAFPCMLMDGIWPIILSQLGSNESPQTWRQFSCTNRDVISSPGKFKTIQFLSRSLSNYALFGRLMVELPLNSYLHKISCAIENCVKPMASRVDPAFPASLSFFQAFSGVICHHTFDSLPAAFKE